MQQGWPFGDSTASYNFPHEYEIPAVMGNVEKAREPARRASAGVSWKVRALSGPFDSLTVHVDRICHVSNIRVRS